MTKIQKPKLLSVDDLEIGTMYRRDGEIDSILLYTGDGLLVDLETGYSTHRLTPCNKTKFVKLRGSYIISNNP